MFCRALLGYLRTLGPTADHALLDAVSRWWEAEDSQSTIEGWAAVGLRVRPDADPQPQLSERPAGSDSDKTEDGA